jgi:hypothetical protein
MTAGGGAVPAKKKPGGNDAVRLFDVSRLKRAPYSVEYLNSGIDFSSSLLAL